jgi:uncharacterized membrane protein YphA (DoxX/SURF4 family)
MDIILIVGRILYGMIFLGSGIAGHLMQADGTAGYAQMRGMNNPKPMVQLSGVLLAAGALGIMTGFWIDLAVLGMVAYLVISNVVIHHFWTDDDAMTRQMEMTQFMKNLALIGAGLILFALADQLGPMIVGPLF